ncbi:MAG: addiction module protein [Verrucomicrobia bacterium]|nr:addiction module protein [Verrucomicrobiota bacterium]
MSALLEQVEREALRLPGEERAELAEKLWESLETAEPLSETWTAEIKRRREEVRERRVKTVPGAKVSRKAWELAQQASR